MNHSSFVKTLCYSGAIPFYILAIISFIYKNFFIFDLFSIYSLVILSFLFGSSWLMIVFFEKENVSKKLIFFIVITPVLLILVEIFIQIQIKLFIYSLCFFGIYLIDNKYLKNLDYLKIRKNLTLQVILSHMLILISIYTDSFWNIF